MRINKYIAHAGVASRRKAEELIKQGLVTVNGQVVRELATTIKSGDKVEVEGQPIYNEEKVYYLLNKPRGVISSVTNKDNLRPLTRGLEIDGKKTKPAVYEILKVDPVKNRSVVQLTIHEGRNHQVKKMFEAVGLQVDKLSRTRFGHLDLTGLRPGESRRLNKKEISQLHTMAVTKK